MRDLLPCPWCVIDELRLNRDELQSQLDKQSEVALKIHDEHQALLKKLEETRADYDHEMIMRDEVQAKLALWPVCASCNQPIYANHECVIARPGSDAVMLEYCPEDMTEPQKQRYAESRCLACGTVQSRTVIGFDEHVMGHTVFFERPEELP